MNSLQNNNNIFFKKEMLKDFFKDLAKNDPKYLAECLKHLLKEDIALLQKYITIKKIE